MEEEYAAIRDALGRLQSLPDDETNLAWRFHRFRTHPTLTEAEVQAFEVAHQITLPAEYRGFLTRVGNGGAGPYYGLFKLGEMDDNWGHKRWREDDGFVGVLTKPFPHIGPWNESGDRPQYDPVAAQKPGWQDEYDRRMEAWDNVYWRTENVNGAIPICHLGCALRQWLVVTGPETGNVWCDDRADTMGLHPLETPGNGRVTFLQWYRSWLDEAARRRL
jgi:hypothetical protein